VANQLGIELDELSQVLVQTVLKHL